MVLNPKTLGPGATHRGPRDVEGAMDPAQQTPDAKFDDDDYPAYTFPATGDRAGGTRAATAVPPRP